MESPLPLSPLFSPPQLPIGEDSDRGSQNRGGGEWEVLRGCIGSQLGEWWVGETL